MAEPSLSEALDQSWSLLMQRRSDALDRTITLSTVDESEQPQACLVVLRDVKPSLAGIEFHTDAESLKVHSLVKNPKAQILLWRSDLSLQLRIDVLVDCHHGERVTDHWKQVPKHSRIAYGKAPPTGAVLSSPFAYKTLSAAKNFMIARCYVQKIDVLNLDGAHWRAQFLKSDHWTGRWISP